MPGLDFNVQESIADVDSLMGSTQHQSVQFPFFVHRPGSWFKHFGADKNELQQIGNDAFAGAAVTDEIRPHIVEQVIILVMVDQS